MTEDRHLDKTEELMGLAHENATKAWPTDAELRTWTLGQLVGNAHQIVLNAPRAKDESDKQTMRLLELAYARLEGVR